jgi:hypothetical protein
MGDWLHGVLAKRNINDPTVTCPLAQGVVHVHVVAHRAGTVAPLRNVATVDATVSGGSNAGPTPTGADGRRGFGLFPAGVGHTVTIAFPPNIADRYDVANVVPGLAQTQNLNPGAPTLYTFAVPWHWIEFHVRDSQNRPHANIPYKLRHRPPLGAVWTLMEASSTPANGNVVKDETPDGRYKLSIPVLSNPVWTNAIVQTGTAEPLTVNVTGLEPGDQGVFEIVDAFDDMKVLHTLPAQVSLVGAGPNLQMHVQWTPSANHLGALTHSRIAFKAKCGGAETLSDARTVVNFETLYVRTPAGAPLVRTVAVHFSGGSTSTVNSINGQAFLYRPWKEHIVRIDLTALQHWRITAQEDGQPDNVLTRP